MDAAAVEAEREQGTDLDHMLDALILERVCVACGCTDDHACPGGCSWAQLNPPICTRCVA